jgi:hypothetical protein
MAGLSIPISVLAALIAAAAGFGAALLLDKSHMQTLTAERDEARDCRHSGSALPPCPVQYRNTRVEWRERIETTQVPDPKQAKRIASLSADLAGAQRTVRALERQLAARRVPRPAAYYYLQNGSMTRPYATSGRCPAGAPVVYVAAASPRIMAAGRTGDPNVCYVRIASRR